MWQVKCNPSVVVAFSSGGNVSSDRTRIQAPLLAERCTEGSSVISRDAGVLFFLQTGEYCQQ